MRSLRITRKDGFAWTVELQFGRLNVGRDPENEIVLPDPAVSRQHCLIECQVDAVTVKDRGTANGTFLNNEVLSEPTPLREGDRVYVGPYLLELVSIVAPTGEVPVPQRPRGPVLRVAMGEATDDQHAARLLRWAREWDGARRPRRLLLRGRLLGEAVGFTRTAQVHSLAQTYVARSSRRRLLTRLAIGLGLVGFVAVASVVAFFAWRYQASEEAPEVAVDETESQIERAPALRKPKSNGPKQRDWVEHVIIPAETMEDVARRYGVLSSDVAKWNGLNADAPDLKPGRTLRVRAKESPLPQQLVEFELDRKYDWKGLSERFEVEPDKLRAYNPGVEKLAKGQRIDVWINPKPYARRSKTLDLPDFDIRLGARSVGAPNDGRIEDAIQMPPSELYVRRAPFIMWGSSHTIETLLDAIVRFRQDLTFDHELVLADISRKRGGNFYPPHKSHQAGRDIDIWMPTLKGVYKTNYLGKDRKPKPNEIDWFATWGLVRALLDTKRVVHIFLVYELQGKLYKAAKMMGASDEELSDAMQWPRGPSASGKVGHAPGHTGHIHVRFKCGPDDAPGCKNDVVRRSHTEEI